ncbi:hypothetical protein PR048_010233 [Dryococelus australis]|uniref:Uncharacterized protein n=1 Tax=Dryococelus australis TaxID=614101 RepID=A0ABQ9I397_9NEOP|nr:hypothetical protein PR048_010233 [Dryococelus australis]
MSPDLSIFDPGSSMLTEFFVSLHELMSGLELRSAVLWCGINLLQRASQNPATHAELIHTYRFTPILTKLLGTDLIYEKKLKVLNLLQASDLC